MCTASSYVRLDRAKISHSLVTVSSATRIPKYNRVASKTRAARENSSLTRTMSQRTIPLSDCFVSNDAAYTKSRMLKLNQLSPTANCSTLSRSFDIGILWPTTGLSGRPYQQLAQVNYGHYFNKENQRMGLKDDRCLSTRLLPRVTRKYVNTFLKNKFVSQTLVILTSRDRDTNECLWYECYFGRSDERTTLTS